MLFDPPFASVNLKNDDKCFYSDWEELVFRLKFEQRFKVMLLTIKAISNKTNKVNVSISSGYQVLSILVFNFEIS